MTKNPKSKAAPKIEKKAKEIRVVFPEKFIREASSVVLKKEAVSYPLQSRMAMRMA